MNKVVQCLDFHLLEEILTIESQEVVLCTSVYSKTGFFNFQQLVIGAEKVKASGRQAVLLWDRIEKDMILEKALADLPRWLENIDAVRVQDFGVALGLKEAFPSLALQLSLEASSPNRGSVRLWSNRLQPARLILSNQLPLSELQDFFVEALPPIEIPVLGPIEVFYSPRLLLNQSGETQRFEAVSEERPRQSSPLFQSPAGTILHHSRELFLLDQLERIQSAGVNWVKLVVSSQEQCRLLAACKPQDYAQLKLQWPKKVTRGFFSANRTDRPLKRLVNQNLFQHRDESVGQVLESKKGSHLLIEIYVSVPYPSCLRLINPEGKECLFSLTDLEPLDLSEVTSFVRPGIYLASWTKGALARSLLLLTK